ncbi:uncharacterized protein LOC121384334 [Gigantopelta aegis]|uniref:uncharacterized protein LOC121384334 n=1 Tax=Gigantopelta aegis TaxID=1735272 RepID=UPI001B88D62D|nr:uncharacterized protein LOC121384334 [Gigantopelta aegis]
MQYMKVIEEMQGARERLERFMEHVTMMREKVQKMRKMMELVKLLCQMKERQEADEKEKNEKFFRMMMMMAVSQETQEEKMRRRYEEAEREKKEWLVRMMWTMKMVSQKTDEKKAWDMEMWMKFNKMQMAHDYMQGKKEADKDSKMEMWMKFNKMQMVHDYMHKQKESDQKKGMMDMWMKFKKMQMAHDYMHGMKEMNVHWTAGDMEEFKKYKMLLEKRETMEDIHELMKTVDVKKRNLSIHLTTQMLKMCKCKEGSTLVSRFFSLPMSDGDDPLSSPDHVAAMHMFQSGDMVGLQHVIKSMDHEQLMSLFFHGLIKSICDGARTFLMYTKRFEETYMNGTMAAYA